ncbi:MAG: hypothetical protein IKB12_00070, partial [Clostridia bacterium]|nr:hypothetical protein [Clostridia bacterium]
ENYRWIKSVFLIHGEQKGLPQKDIDKSLPGNFQFLRRLNPKACFCLLLSQDTKVSARRIGEHTMKSLVQQRGGSDPLPRLVELKLRITFQQKQT